MAIQTLTQKVGQFEFNLQTKPGVFAEKGLDLGTQLLLDHLQVSDETVVADLGSGTGIIGFYAAKLNPRGHVHLLDDHLRAVELAKENAELNHLRNVEVYLSDLFSSVGPRTYHQIISNPPQQLGNQFLEELISAAFDHLKPGGELWLVVKSNLKSLFSRLLEPRFSDLKVVAQNKSYLILRATK